MSPQPNRTPARLIAPLALALVAVLVFVVISGSGGSSNSGGGKTTAGKTETQPAKVKVTKRTYTVKTGDTLGGIAVATGIEVETLQELNPELDPQALVTGQKIKLRE